MSKEYEENIKIPHTQKYSSLKQQNSNNDVRVHLDEFQAIVFSVLWREDEKERERERERERVDHKKG